MITIRNQQLTVKIAPMGAEMQSIFSNGQQTEYLWNADPAFWNRHAPVLFPIVGQLKEDTYFYNGKSYHLPRHGFARDKVFAAEQVADNEALFTLKSDNDTYSVYPFSFALCIHYKLHGPEITITYNVTNTGDEEMYFSIGAHPAFNVPLADGTAYTDYQLRFNVPEAGTRCTLENNLIASHTMPFTQNPVPLTHELFYKDALVLKDLYANIISLESDRTGRGITVDFSGFPYLGIWSAKDAPFVCIEPWHGIADTANHNQQLQDKEGIMRLGSRCGWSDSWKIIIC